MSSSAYCLDCGKSKAKNNGFSHEHCIDKQRTDGSLREMTFKEIGAALNLTPERCRQIYTGAIVKMRKILERENGK